MYAKRDYYDLENMNWSEGRLVKYHQLYAEDTDDTDLN